LKIEMIGLASQDAKKIALNKLQKSTGDKVGEVRSSKTGVMQVNAKKRYAGFRLWSERQFIT